ncbi:uncharacterized protein V6R79_013395, partial [Siganus canaliculatus]
MRDWSGPDIQITWVLLCLNEQQKINPKSTNLVGQRTRRFKRSCPSRVRKSITEHDAGLERTGHSDQMGSLCSRQQKSIKEHKLGWQEPEDLAQLPMPCTEIHHRARSGLSGPDIQITWVLLCLNEQQKINPKSTNLVGQRTRRFKRSCPSRVRKSITEHDSGLERRGPDIQ